MFSNKNLAYLLTALEAIEKINIYSSGFDNPESFYEANDQLNFNACFNLLIVIGEETRKIEPLLKRNFPEVEWRKISGLRNHLVHEYRGIDPAIIFDIISRFLSGLKETLIKMLQVIDHDKEELLKILESDYYKHLKYLIEK